MAAGQEPALSRTPAPISSLACLVHLLALLPACPFVSFSLLSGLPSDLPELFSPSVYRFRRQDLLLGPPTSFGKFVFLADETFANEKKPSADEILSANERLSETSQNLSLASTLSLAVAKTVGMLNCSPNSLILPMKDFELPMKDFELPMKDFEPNSLHSANEIF